MKFYVPLAAVALALSPLAVIYPVRIQGPSMEPTLQSGDLRWALRGWVASAPSCGEIWVVETPDGVAVKRVLATPGQSLRQQEGRLERNGVHLHEGYVTHPEAGPAGPWQAESGYLVLGDNRPASRDSRSWGALPRSAFRARLIGKGLE